MAKMIDGFEGDISEIVLPRLREGVHREICEGTLALTNKYPIPSAGTGESIVSYHKMKGNCYRYLAEFSTGDDKNKAAEDARVEYAESTKVTERIVSSPISRRWHSECQHGG